MSKINATNVNLSVVQNDSTDGAFLETVKDFVGTDAWQHRAKSSSIVSLRSKATLWLIREKIKQHREATKMTDIALGKAESKGETLEMPSVAVDLLTGNRALSFADLYNFSTRVIQVVNYRNVPSEAEIKEVLTYLLQDFCEANNFVTEEMSTNAYEKYIKRTTQPSEDALILEVATKALKPKVSEAVAN